ncbi:hypothetical protein RHS01_09357 [Rhizoctonia solani]|uniref:Uncharacterized protein n=1 Tax=Rhizoctonia solani TaxID=456999 RepID=A0A8H7I6Z2_9AGAM|nr:hypothetical protein RHS01_09357 [Rhizoctonia solani]
MLQRRKANIQCSQNFSLRGGAAPQVLEEESHADKRSNNPVALSSQFTPHDKIPPNYTHSQLHCASKSPDKLAGNLDALTLEVPQLDDNVVLEDPPNNEEDPTDNWNLPSLADPENNQNPNLPPPKEPKVDEDSSRKGEPTNQGQISLKKAKGMVEELQEFIELSFYGYGKMHVCSLGNVVLTQLWFMAGTPNLMVEMEMKLIVVSTMAAFVFC